MDQIIWLILRRMRPPLLVLISIYSIATLGMVLVPGIEVDGEITHLNFFQAYYFISYTATTIGFGEIPREFSNAQRMWALCCIYMSVIAWLYSIGSILSLMQDQTFRQALVKRRFAKSVRHIRERFFLLCGYGEAGKALVEILAQYHIRAVVIDHSANRINELSLQDQKLPVHVPGLCADANIPEHLLEAGLQHPLCSKAIALTGDDKTNLKIAITSKLLNPELEVLARASDKGIKANIASFGTEEIIDPFQIFGETLALALHSPNQYLLKDWLTGVSHNQFKRPELPPRGKWIVCGYGRLGNYLVEQLDKQGLPAVIIELDPDVSCGKRNIIIGRGTEAETLIEAGVEDAVGIIAGTDNDQNNLSIIMTAKQLNPDLFFIARQNLGANKAIFDAFEADIIVNASDILAKQIHNLITTPRLAEFLELIKEKDDEWARAVFTTFDDVIGTEVAPDIWIIKINQQSTPAVMEALSNGYEVCIKHLIMDPYVDYKALRAHPLMLVRDGEPHLLPSIDSNLQDGDRVLLCGVGRAYNRTIFMTQDYFYLLPVVSGTQVPRSGLLRWLLGHKGKLKESAD